MHTPDPAKVSVNTLLLGPLKARWYALRALWWYRTAWMLPAARLRMLRERDRELAECLPITVVLGLVAGVLIFVVLPSSLKEQSATVLATLWPLWVVQAAPMICAQSMAMQNAPTIALRLTEAQDRKAFGAADSLGSAVHNHEHRGLVARMVVPWIAAHAIVCTAQACLLVAFTLAFGLLAGLVLAVGDLRLTIDVVFARVPPLVWLRAAFSAFVLGGVCVLAAVLYAWPGSQSARTAHDAHRTGLRTMLASSVACALAGMSMNWIAGLLGWNGMVR